MHHAETSTTDRRREEIARLAPWFHNLHLPDGTQTAPEHWLGDFPRFKWDQLAASLPDDLAGWTALDIGCNAGFYSVELARRGAAVTALDTDPRYLRQAHWAVQQFGLERSIQLVHGQVYDVARWEQSFDLILFMGVFYHLRYPLLALDLLARRTRRLLVFQSLTLAENDPPAEPRDYNILQRDRLSGSGWPRMAFIEKTFQGDPTNWWVPNAPAVEALLRSSGLELTAAPGHELYIARPGRSSSPAPALDEAEFRAALGLDRPQVAPAHNNHSRNSGGG